MSTSYPESQLCVVTQNVTASQQLDLTLAKGCVVAVIKESDPMGNRDRWYIDNGGQYMNELKENIYIFIMKSYKVQKYINIDSTKACTNITT